MTKKMKKMAEIFKLEERVLFDAAAVADVVEAVQNDPAVQGQQSAEDKQAEDDKNALKNAGPENPAEAAQQGTAAEEQAKEQPTSAEAVPSADPDAAAKALVEGAIPDAEQANETAEQDAATGEITGEAEQVLPDGEAETAEADGDAGAVKAEAEKSGTDEAVNGEAAAETVAADVEATSDAEAAAEQAKADDSDGNGEIAFAEAFESTEQETGKELVIINSSIRDSEAFIEEAGKDADVLVLAAGDDALDQINEFLDAHDGKYSSVHIITHGSEGYFLLSGDVVTAESVVNDPAGWAAIGDHLTADADVMIYSCNLAGNVEGQNLVAAIANLTGADVAASTDITGRGGNWDLEYAIGTIDHSALFADKYAVNYDCSLTAYESISVASDYTSYDDSSYDYQFDNGHLQYRTKGSQGAWTDANAGYLSWVVQQNDATDITVRSSGTNATTVTAAANLSGKTFSTTLDKMVTLSFNGGFTVNANAETVFGTNVKGAAATDSVTIGNGATLDGVTLNGNMEIDSSVNWTIKNGKIDGNILIRPADGAEADITPTLEFYHVVITGDIQVGSIGNYTYDYSDGSLAENGVHKATLTLQGDDITVQGTVTDAKNNKATIEFVRGGTSLKSYTSTNWFSAYNYADNAYYLTNEAGSVPGAQALYSQDKLTQPTFKGEIRVIGVTDPDEGDRAEGTINFNGDVVSVHSFEVLAGNVNFAKTGEAIVAAAGGTFRISEGEVTGLEDLQTHVAFNSKVYVSTPYNSIVDTTFRVDGGTVVFSGDLQNWVRSWRGNTYTYANTKYADAVGGAVKKASSGDFVTYTEVVTKDGKTTYTDYSVLYTTTKEGLGTPQIESVEFDKGIESYKQSIQFVNSTHKPSSSVIFADGNVTFNSGSTVRNYAVFGNAAFSVETDCTATLGSIVNVSLQSYSEQIASQNPWAQTQTWHANWVTEYAAATANDDVKVSSYDGKTAGIYSSFSPNGYRATALLDTNVTVQNDITNGASYLTISGTSVTVSGEIKNEARGWASGYISSTMVVTGSQHQFVNLDENVSGGEYSIRNTGASKLTISGDHTIGTIYVYSTMNDPLTQRVQTSKVYFQDAANTSFSLVSDDGGETLINGSGNEGINLVSANVKKGFLNITSELGDNGISATLDIGSSGTVEINAKNILNSTVTNYGKLLIGAGDGGTGAYGTEISGNITNYGTFTVNAYSVFTGKVNNTRTGNYVGDFILAAAGMVLDGNLTNDARLTVGKITTFLDMENTANGTIAFTQSTAKVQGAEGTVFGSLKNAGTIKVTVDNLVFRDGLTNSGQLTIGTAAKGTRFANMFSDDGKITFVNTGRLNLYADSQDGEFLDVSNGTNGWIDVRAKINFGLVENAAEATIDVNTGSSSALIYGALDNEGTISGIGTVKIYGSAEGGGKFSVTGADSLAEYDFTDRSTETGALIDMDGFVRINGYVITDVNGSKVDGYTNRPVFDYSTRVWKIGGVTADSENNEYAHVSTYVSDGKTYWQIGLNQTDTEVTGRAEFDGTGSTWKVTYNGSTVDTGYATTGLTQQVYGGTAVNLTLLNDGAIWLGDMTGKVPAELEVTGILQNGEFNGGQYAAGTAAKLNIADGSSLTFSGTAVQDATESTWSVKDGGTMQFNMKGTQDIVTLNGLMENNGTVGVTADRSLILTGKTSGDGKVTADEASVEYAYTSTADGLLYRGNYETLILQGTKTASGDVTAGTLETAAGTTVNVNTGTLTVNTGVSGDSANYMLGKEGKIVLDNKGAAEWDLGNSTIDLSANAAGLVVNGGTGGVSIGQINNLAGESETTGAVGVVLNGKADIHALTNDGADAGSASGKATTRINGTAVTVASLKIHAGSVYLNLGAGGSMTFDQTADHLLSGNDQTAKAAGNHLGGQLVVESGELVLSGTAAQLYDLAVTVKKDAVFTVSSSQSIKYVTVDDGGTFNVQSAGTAVTVGWVNGKAAGDGLTLNGRLNVLDSAQMTLYRYDTAAVSTASIKISGALNGGTMLTLTGTAANYGTVRTADGTVELINGTLSDANQRFDGETRSWIYVDHNTATTQLGDLSNCSIQVAEGVTLTVDGRGGTEYSKDLTLENVQLLNGAVMIVGVSAFQTQAPQITVTGDLTAAAAQVTVNASAVLTVNKAAVTNTAVTVNGTMTMEQGVTVSGTGDTSAVAGTGKVIYGGGELILNGTYKTLELKNSAAATVGDITVSSAIQGTGTITFTGTNQGAAQVTGNGISAVYGETAEGVVYKGVYQSLTFIGSHTAANDSTAGKSIDVRTKLDIQAQTGSTDLPKLNLKDVDLTVGDGVKLSGIDTATIKAEGDSTVRYDSSVSRKLYSGEYRTLEVTGSGEQSMDRLYVRTVLKGYHDAAETVRGTLNIKAVEQSSAKADDINMVYGESISRNFLGGTYENLTIIGSGSITENVTVNGKVKLGGSITGSGDLTFNGQVTGAGTGLIGTEEEAYTGTVTYAMNEAGRTQYMYGGNVKNAVLAGQSDKVIGSDLTMETLTVNDGIRFALTDKSAVTAAQILLPDSADAAISVGASASLTTEVTEEQILPVIEANGTLNLSGTHVFRGSELTVAGTLNVLAESQITLNGTETAQTAVFRANAADARLVLTGIGTAEEPALINRLVSYGTEDSSGGIYVLNSNLNVTGSTPFSGTGYISIDGNSTLLQSNTSGTGTFTGTFNLGAGSSLTVNGNLTLSGTLVTLGSIKVGSNIDSTASLHLYTVDSGDKGLSTSNMTVVGTSARLIFDPSVTQTIHGTVTGEPHEQIVYTEGITSFDELLSYWITVGDGETVTVGADSGAHGYDIQAGGTVIIGNSVTSLDACEFVINAGGLLDFGTGQTVTVSSAITNNHIDAETTGGISAARSVIFAEGAVLTGTGLVNMTAGTVTYYYDAAAVLTEKTYTVYSGVYSSLTIYGESGTDIQLDNNITVNDAAVFTAEPEPVQVMVPLMVFAAASPVVAAANNSSSGLNITGSGDLTFNGTYTGGTITKETAGTVTYGEEFNFSTAAADNVYYDLVINSGTAENPIVLDNVAIMNTFGGRGYVQFTGSASGTATANMADGSTVVYSGDNVTPYVGTYGNIVFSGNGTVNIAGAVNVLNAVTMTAGGPDGIDVSGSEASLSLSALNGSADQYLQSANGAVVTFTGNSNNPATEYTFSPELINSSAMTLANGIYDVSLTNRNVSTLTFSNAGLAGTADLANGGTVYLLNGSDILLGSNYTEIGGAKIISAGADSTLTIENAGSAEFETALIVTANGRIELNAANLNYSGNVTLNGSNAVLDINAASVFSGTVKVQAGAMYQNASGTVFNGDVYASDRFFVTADTVFNGRLIVVHDMQVGGNDPGMINVAFNNSVFVIASDGGSITVGGTALSVAANTRNTELQIGDNVVSSFSALNGVYVSNQVTTGSWMAALTVDGTAAFPSAVTVESSGKTAELQLAGTNIDLAQEVTISGTAASVSVTGSHIRFLNTVTNQGTFKLNGEASFADFVNSRVLNVGSGAGNAVLQELANTGTVNVNGAAQFWTVTNTGTFNVNAGGSTFRDVTNSSGLFNVNGKTCFEAVTVTGGSFVIGKNGSGSVFTDVVNSAVMTVNSGAAKVVFSGSYVLTQGATLNLGGADTVFKGTVDNSGTIKVTGGRDGDSSTHGNEIKGTLIMRALDSAETSGSSTLTVSSTGELTLYAVQDVWQGTVGSPVYYVKVVVTVTDSETGEVTTTTTVQEVDQETYETTETGTTTEGETETTTSKYIETVMVDGNQPKMNVADQGILRFMPLSEVQTIYSHVEVNGDGEIQYVYGKTVFTDINYTDWILLNGSSTITAYGKYRVNDGADVTVNGNAFGSSFRVDYGGTLTVNSGFNVEQLVNQGGTVSLNGGTYAGSIANDFGVMTVSSATVSGNLVNGSALAATGSAFTGTVSNSGTMTLTHSSADVLNNSGTLTLTGSTANVLNNYDTLTLTGSTVTELNNDGNAFAAGSTSTVTALDNSGRFTVNAAGKAAVTRLNNDNGTLKVLGTLNYGGEVTGSLEVTGGTVNGDLTLSGTVSGSNAAFNGTVTYTGTRQNVIDGSYRTLTIDGTGTQIAGQVSAGTLNVQSSLNVLRNAGLNATAINGIIAGNAGTVTAARDVTVTTNSGTLNAGGAADVTTNSGTLNGHGTVGTNTGVINADGTMDVASSSGTINVLGNNVTLTGFNRGTVTVSGKGALYLMSSAASAKLSVGEGGSVTLNTDLPDAFGGKLTNRGTVSLTKGGLEFAAVDNAGGTINVSVEPAALQMLLNAGGTVNLRYAADLTGRTVGGSTTVGIRNAGVTLDRTTVNNGTISFACDYMLDTALTNNGTIEVAGSSTLTVDASLSRLSGNYRTTAGSTINLTGAETTFSGSVSNAGSIRGDSVTFNGVTDGNGTMYISGTAVYGVKAVSIFGGFYNAITVNSAGTVQHSALIETLDLNGSLATAKGVTVTFNGSVNGSGTMAGGEGTVVYGSRVTDRIYTGTYHNVQFRNDARLNGDAVITGNAVLSGNGTFTAGSGTVTYQSDRAQTMVEGVYNNLTLSGSGAKVMTAGSGTTVRGSMTVTGSKLALTPIISGNEAQQYRMAFNADRATFHYAYIDGLNYMSGTLHLDGTNRLGRHVSHVETFNAAGGIGYSFPDAGNTNFSSLAFSLASELDNARAYESQLLSEFRQYRGEMRAKSEAAAEMRLDSEAGSFFDDGMTAEDEVSQMFSEDIPAADVQLETGDVVAASAAFRDDLDEALENILKA